MHAGYKYFGDYSPTTPINIPVVLITLPATSTSVMIVLLYFGNYCMSMAVVSIKNAASDCLPSSHSETL